MARYKLVDRSARFLPIVLESQLIPGSFEHALDVLVDTEIDLEGLGARFCNDLTGAPAYAPAVMLKIVLLAYSRGVVSSRAIERLCRENVLFMAISGDSVPRFTTIAAFVRELGEDAATIFTQVLLTCCQRDPKFPQVWEPKIPHPVHASASSARTRPAFNFSFSRYELPRMLSVTA